MNAKLERFKNTLYYYKPYIVIGMIVIAALILGFWVSGPKAPDADLNIALVGQSYYVTPEAGDAITKELQEKIPNDINDDGQKLAYVDLLTGLDSNPEGRQRVDLEVAVGKSRLLILDEASAEAFAKEEYMTDLSPYAKEYGLEQANNIYALPLRSDSFLSPYIQTDGLVVCLKAMRVNEEQDQQVFREYQNAYSILDLICEPSK